MARQVETELVRRAFYYTQTLKGRAQTGHVAGVQFYHKNSMQYKAERNKALCAAAGTGHLEVVQFLVQSGADVKFRMENAQCAVDCAAEAGDADVVNYFTLNGLNPRDATVSLYWALEKGDLKTIQHLVDASADYKSSREFPVLRAVARDYLDVLQYFIHLGAIRNVENGSALKFAARCGHVHIVRYLISRGNVPREQIQSALSEARLWGEKDIVEFLELQ